MDEFDRLPQITKDRLRNAAALYRVELDTIIRALCASPTEARRSVKAFNLTIADALAVRRAKGAAPRKRSWRDVVPRRGR